ncbi:MAG: hypothetical protein R2828_03925 [Saprospiraceae bacterium]
MRKVKTRLLILAASLLPMLLHAQGSTLYSTSSGNWGDAIWASSPSGTPSVSNPDDPNTNIVIQSGHTVLLNASEKAMQNLTVESGATLKVGSGTTRYLEIYGNATLNGTIGGAADGLSFDINGPACTIGGVGTTTLKRLRKDNDPGGASTTNLSIDQHLTLTYSASSSAALYNNGAPNSTFNVTISSGKKLTLTSSDVSIDGIDGSNSFNLSGTFTINGTLDIQQGNLWLATDNTSGKDIAYEIGKNGKLIVGGKIYGNAGIGGTAKAKLSGSGRLELKSNGDIFQQLDPSRNTIIFQTGANVIFSNASPQNIPPSITYQSLTVQGGGNKVLQGSTTINGTLYLEGGYVLLGNHNLTINNGGDVSGGSSLSYVKTNDSGGLLRKVGSSPISFPVGNSSYNPVRLFNTFSAVSDWYTIRVTDQVLDEGDQGLPLVSEAVSRTWFISEAVPGGSNLDVQLQWNANEELPGFNRSQSFLTRWLSSEWQSTAPSAAAGSGPFRQSMNGITTLSAFSLGSNSVLPIELGYFTGARQTDGIALQWETLSEENNDYMAIERSADGQRFEEMGRLNGRGTVFEPQRYQFLDERPIPGLNYYRLRQVDYDGTATFHDIITVAWEAQHLPFSVFPTMARESVNVHWQEASEKVLVLRLFSSTGQLRQQYRVPPGTSAFTLPTGGLPPGHYFLHIDGAAGLEQARFVKAF